MPILSRHAYLKALLTGKAIDKSLPAVTSVSPVEQIVPQPEAPGVQAQENLRKREAEKLRIVRAEIEDLNPAALAKLLSDLKLNFVERKVSQAVMKRLDDGNWESALIMGELVRFYWKLTRGTDWTTPEPLPKVERVEQAGLF
jgi:hypothetical protein